MADVTQRMLADCRAAQAAKVGRAEALHAAALRQAASATETARIATDALSAAEAEWHRQMADGFDPVLGTMLAHEVLGCATAAERAAAVQVTAEAARDRSADGWRREDARRAALEAEAAVALRRMRRHADERLLASLADRETFRRAAR